MKKVLKKKIAISILDGISKEAKETRDRLGNFIYTKRPSQYLEWRDLYTDPDGFKYFGQWNQKTNTREGIGITVMENGSINEGYRRNGFID